MKWGPTVCKVGGSIDSTTPTTQYHSNITSHAAKESTEQTRSEAGAIVTTVLFGGLGSKTGSGSLTMVISDGKTGDMLRRFFKAMNDGVFTSSDELIDRMMRKVSRNFPYSK